ncbi:MAG TPA: hypothetical protein VNO70_07120, partial [Blastocatellia bacterium]|nr:hypothetical protein [Blastocatellia bacterium]
MLDSVRVRLTLWYVGVLALVLLAFGVGVYALLSRSLYKRVDDGLRSVIEVATRSLIHDTEEGQSSLGAAESTVAELFNRQQALAIFDGAGRLLAGKAAGDDFYARLPDLGQIPDQEASLFTAPEENDDDDEYYRVAVQRVSIPPLNTPYIILASQPLEGVEDELESLREILYYAVPAALALAGLGGWFLAHKSLAPVVAMSEQARRIGAENL